MLAPWLVQTQGVATEENEAYTGCRWVSHCEALVQAGFLFWAALP